MENIVKWSRRLVPSGVLSLVGLLLFATMALATPSNVTDFVVVVVTENVSENVSLVWVKASGSTHTVIRYGTEDFPSEPTADGTLAYNGTGSYATLSGLTAGTPYYFSAWGWDGGDYSPNATEVAFSMPPLVVENTTIPYARPTMPAEAWQDPDTSGWSIEPIDDILNWFADPSVERGGLGMPVNNLVMFMVGVGVSGASIYTYVRWRSFYTSWFILLGLCSFFCAIEVMQWIVVGFLLLAGAGKWAVDNATQ